VFRHGSSWAVEGQTLLGNHLFDSWIPGVVLWALLYISDYTCTIASARAYRAGVSENIEFEGSFELTPFYQADVNALRHFSPRFLAALLWMSILLVVVWACSQQLPGWEPVYEVVLGGAVLIECAIHMRHFRNLYLFRIIRAGNCVSGRIAYTRTLLLRASAVELLSFAGFYLLLSVLLGSWFLLGGALACLATARNHRALARRQALQKGDTSSQRAAT